MRCDVLVVGGGGAALRAAHEAARLGSSVVLVLRGRRLGMGGATSFGVVETAGYAIPDGYGDPDDDVGTFRDDVLRTAQGCTDPALVDILVQDAIPATELLRNHGLAFITNPDGSELVARGDFASRSRNRKIYGHGKPIAKLLATLVEGDDRVEVLSSATVVDLLVDRGRVVGGLVVDRDGELVAVAAGATILATGGAGQLFSHSLMPTDITGSGYALAARAGADLVNMEFVQAGFGTLRPAVNMVMPWYWGSGAELLDAEKRPVLPDVLTDDGPDAGTVTQVKRLHYPFSSSDPSGLLELAAHHALRTRPLTERGGLLMHLPEDDADDEHGFWAMSRAWLRDRGFDLSSRLIEVSLFGHSVNGGAVVDIDGRTTVDGLYAAGETTGGAYGADRLGGTMLLSCQVFGRRSAVAAHAEARAGLDREAVLNGLVDDAVERFRGAVPVHGEIPPREAIRQVKRLMTEHVLVGRDDKSLQSARVGLDELADAVRGGAVAAGTIAERLAVEDIRNLLLVGQLMVAAAAARNESRGAHYRRDYPRPDPLLARRQRWRWRDGTVAPVDGH